MSITPSMIDPRRATAPMENPTEEVDPVEKKRKRVFMAFGAMAGMVLVLAVGYVGTRVLANSRPEAPKANVAKTPEPIRIVRPAATPVATTAVVTPQVQPPVATIPAASAEVKPIELPKPVTVQLPAPKPIHTITRVPVAWTTMTPHTGETYLQVIALPKSLVGSFLAELEAKNLTHPVVALSPVDGVYRVLFGPLESGQKDEMRKQLEAAGLQPMLQLY